METGGTDMVWILFAPMGMGSQGRLPPVLECEGACSSPSYSTTCLAMSVATDEGSEGGRQ
jgi:hypothetical protein